MIDSLSEDALHTLPVTITAALAPTEIAPTNGFMIDADGNRILSVYQEPRICVACGVSFTPAKPRGLSNIRRLPVTCSEPCRRRYATRSLTAVGQELAATKNTRAMGKASDAQPPALKAKPAPKPAARLAPPKPAVPQPADTPIQRPPKLVQTNGGRAYARDEIKDPGTDLGRAVLKRRYAVSPPLTQDYLAIRIGASPSSFDGWMRGRVAMPAQKLAMLANVLCCTMEQLWYDR